IPIVLFPYAAVGNLTMVNLFLAFLFFMLNFGFLGSEGIAQTYFLGLVPSDRMLDMGILYFLLFGIAGAGGSFIAGLLLDTLMFVGLSPFVSFKILFSAIIVLAAVAVLMQRRLTPLGALPLSGAVRVMFSYRDLQAISLLDRLDRSRDFQEQEQLLDALHRNPSQLSIKGLLEQARSPRLATRMEAIRALERVDRLNEAAEKALVDDVIGSQFTTAYISARILGNHGYVPAIPILRELVGSTDYMLAGEAMIALARLGDSAFRPRLEEIIVNTLNPRLKIMGVESLGIYRSPDSLDALVRILKGADPPPYLRDEVALAMSEIVGIQTQFSRSLVRFLSEPNLAPALALDAAETAAEFFAANSGGIKAGRDKGRLSAMERQAGTMHAAVSALVHSGDPAPLSGWIRELPDSAFAGSLSFKTARGVFSGALLDAEAISHKHLQLLICHWAAHQIRICVRRG
ncbi:MAG: MFS transporter, partial [Treponema sp.]|nr:MFS transporter [Treponema sp.]